MMFSFVVVSKCCASRRLVAAAAAVSPLRSSPQRQQQQRLRWTEARKKRQARWERRKEFAEKGIESPKPPGYFPRDTPVVNALTRDEKIAESKENDERVSKELHERLKAAQEQPVLRHHNMTDGD